MHQPKCAPRSTVAVSLVGTSAAGAGSWGLRFVPRWFQRVCFCFFVFFGSVNRYIPSKDVKVVCTRIFFGKITMFVRMEFVFPVKKTCLFIPFVFGFTDGPLT